MNDLNNHNTGNETLKNLAPMLFAMSKRNSFNIPEGYFETLPHLIQERCVAATHKKSLWESLRIYVLRPQPLLAAACLSIAFFFSLHYVKQQNNTITKDDGISAIYLNELDENTLEEGIVSNSTNTSIDKEAATEYLLEQNIDPSQLNN